MAEEKNYITPKGLEALRAEYHELFHVERPRLVEVIAWAASNGDRSENADYIYGKRRLREIDKRLGFLGGRIEKAEVVDPSQLKAKNVVFGATIVVVDEQDKSHTYQIVGVDEADAGQGRISWKSPLARAFLGKKEGDEVTVHRPTGEAFYVLESIEYK